MMTLRPYQEEAREAVHKEWRDGRRRTLLVLPTGCHAKGEKVLLANGKSIEVEKVRAGDRLLGSDGTARTVLALTSGVGELYRIIPVKGKPFTVTGDHMLTLVRTNECKKPYYPCEKKQGEIVDVSVTEYLNWSKSRKHLYKLFRSSEIKTFPDAQKEALQIEPYFLGVLLGDGGLKHGINVTTPDREVFSELLMQAQKYNMHLREEDAGNAKTYWFVQNDNKSHYSDMKKALIDSGIARQGAKTKSVPIKYKTAPSDIRLEVIAGLIDTDGSYHDGVYDFISASEQLSEDLAFMCRSVGLAAYVNAQFKKCRNFDGDMYYRVSISGNCDIIPCRVKRKQSPERRQKKNVLRTGFSVEHIGTGEYYGFTVNCDNRYLLDDFTVTHNCGKTIVFAKIVEDCVREGKRVLILAHRGELLEQAADKILKSTGLMCAVEKAEQSCIGSFFRIVVGSVQSIQRPQRLEQFDEDYFDTIIIDEAHHVLSDGYLRVLEHFCASDVLGVTATPDRGDMKNLGQVFESLAYEYTLPKAIREGYLSPIKALTIPIKLDLSAVSMQNGDFKVGDIGTALDPYLEQIADEMLKNCADRKTVVFLPLIKTSQKFCDILNKKGFNAAEVNGQSQDRAEILADFDQDKYNVLCNSMLLTEGWDCPSVDCVIVLRPTKVRSLYSQMVGRGTRLCEGKKELLLLDFLWHTEKHELCHPAHLICENEEVTRQMTKNMEEAACPVDIEEAEEKASEDVVRSREESLAKTLDEMKTRKRKLVDPLQFEMSIQAEDLSNYVPSFGWEMAPASDKQIEALQKYGIFPDEIGNAGKAKLLLDKLHARQAEGLTTPRQIRLLESRGFRHVGTWQFDDASKLISRIAANGWRVPSSVNPIEYIPGQIRS